MRAARLALLHRGADGVRVEVLAHELGVTKGSFYWHFRDRADLLEALLVEWEEETGLLTDALRQSNPRGQLPAILRTTQAPQPIRGRFSSVRHAAGSGPDSGPFR